MTTSAVISHPIAACSARSAPAVAACALRVSAGDDLLRLIPAGQFDAPRGSLEGQGPWRLDEPHARALIAQAAARSTDIVIDYEHQTLLAERNGQPAPAAGWVDPRSLAWHEDGLYGRVQWTAAGRAAITPGEDGSPAAYRYLSPVFPYDRETGDVLDLLHVALTNTPAIDTAIAGLAAARLGAGSPPAPNSDPDPDPEDNIVDRDALIQLLGLAADATDEQITAAIVEMQKKAAAADETRAAVAATSAGAPADMSQYVPRAVYAEAQTALAALRAGAGSAELGRMVDEGLKDGRIPGKATADWLRTQGLAACRAYLEGATPIAALAARQTDGRPPDAGAKKDALSDSELAVCRAMGIAPADYRKANDEE